MEIQIHYTETNYQSPEATLNDSSGLQNASGAMVESPCRVNDQKQHPERKMAIFPLTVNEQVLTESRTCRINSGKDMQLL